MSSPTTQPWRDPVEAQKEAQDEVDLLLEGTQTGYDILKFMFGQLKD